MSIKPSLLLKISLFLIFSLNYHSGASAQTRLTTDVKVNARFASPSELTVIQLDFNEPLNDLLVERLGQIAIRNHYIWDVKPQKGVTQVVLKSEESYKGYGYHFYKIMWDENIELDKKLIELHFRNNQNNFQHV